MPTYKAAVIKEAGSKFVIEEREIPTPQAGEVLIKVAACGVCHQDKFSVNGWMPGIAYPIVPGHEAVGTVENVGEGVEWPVPGMVVGVGWHGRHCLFCEQCRRGEFVMCARSLEMVTGIHRDGGYAEYMIAHWTGIVELPEGITPVDAAPLLCAGVAVFNALRHQDNLVVGDVVAIHGIGGVGHLGIQFAKRMGYNVVAISSSGEGKKETALKLGCNHYIDTSKKEGDEEQVVPSDELLALGGAKVIIATSPDTKSTSELVNGLCPNGRIVLIGSDMSNLELNPIQVIANRSQICGWKAGVATDCTEACIFANDQNIKSINEIYKFDKVQEAYDHMASGKSRYRVVLKMI